MMLTGEHLMLAVKNGEVDQFGDRCGIAAIPSSASVGAVYDRAFFLESPK
jgi:hypothetical protein